MKKGISNYNLDELWTSIYGVPASRNFSVVYEQEGRDYDNTVEGSLEEISANDPAIENAGEEVTVIAMLRALPKDRYRVVALLLFLRELGYDFRYEDIGSVWGNKKVSVFNTISRMRKALVKAGIDPKKKP